MTDTVLDSPTPAARAQTVPRPPAVDVVVPVFNEQGTVAGSVRRVHAYLRDRFPFSARVTVVDNASTDGTWQVARELAAALPGVRAVHLGDRGRGRALRHAWSHSDAVVVAYMDVDLSTDLDALLPLVAPLLSGHSDVAIGSRLARSSRVLRGPKRELVSRAYNLLLHTSLGTGFSDAQCGFKAVRGDVVRTLLPLVRDEGWFFDTELLVVAERAGLRIHEVPVDWVDDPDSRVDLVRTAVQDLRGVARLGWSFARGAVPLERVVPRARPARTERAVPAPGQVLRFLGVGVLSTLAYLGIYLLLRTGTSAQTANLVALLVSAVANTAANRRYTFAVRGRRHALRHQLQGLAVFAAALALTAGSLAALHAAVAGPPRAAEVLVLVTANLLATALRFVALRAWVFRATHATGGGSGS